ncbi:leucine ABC transporter subunit substrate-binding protein LivK [Variovorax sp. SRS16]|uniref:ABC transporter substrate-binding protein n=1 Tax=Variovorax sp. SRS16 TaxID=282217 RepID=UPI001318987E|nr:ABC transporter substrate-binding protein [Variovorax sp. SRS16]VTU29910.1 leucine ABC transporter subunit substrate-binding protein LivK [Variovorax sp. SRS16]
MKTHASASSVIHAPRRLAMRAAVAAGLLLSFGCMAQSPAPIKIGVLNDQSGIAASLSGQGSVVAARMAVEDFGGSVAGRKVEVVYADHQYKPDVGSAIVRRWFDTEGVTAVVDVPSSAVALAVQEVTRQANRVALFTSPAASQLTGKACSPNGIQWAQDTYGMANGAPPELLKTGNDSWYFITIDYAYGTATEKDARDVIEAHHGKVVGSVKHAANAGDFSSQLLQAQASKAKVIALATAGDDMSNLVKQAAEFGISGHGQTIAPLTTAMFNAVHGLGLKSASGLVFTESFYWDRNDKSRQFSKRFLARHGTMPSAIQGDTYSAVTHYLKALATGVNPMDGIAVVKAMRDIPGDDFGSPAKVRVDGRVERDLYMFKVKTPEQSKYAWDYYTLQKTLPAASVTRAPTTECSLVKAL